jgi:hypothetical protein
MQIHERPARRDPPLVAIILGLFVTLVGASGDLIWHALNPEAHANLLSLASGEGPWHLALFGGIAISTAGAVMWAVRLRSHKGLALGAALMTMLLVTTAAGAWSLAAGGTGAHENDGEAAPGHEDQAAQAGTPAAQVDEAAPATDAHGAAVGRTTPAERAELAGQLAVVRAATRKYMDVAVAERDGYFQVTQFIPGLGLHMFNLKHEGSFDPARPQLLLYTPGQGGELSLAGVAYSIPKRSDEPPAGFAGGEDVWHSHNNLCFLPSGSVAATTAEDCQAQNGFFQESTGWLLHAWVFQDNPHGVFVEQNPTVR